MKKKKWSADEIRFLKNNYPKADIEMQASSVYSLRYSIFDSNLISLWMYKNSNIHLNRKFDKFTLLAKDKGLRCP